jgi:hypothetical protein
VGANDGLHSWPDSTNLCLQSEDFSTTWAPSNGTITVNQTIAPDGSLTADLLEDDGLTGNANIIAFQGITVADATSYVVSVFAKADQDSWVRLFINQTVDPGCYFDLANGVVGTANDNDDAGIEDYGNGWYRCWMAYTSDSTSNTVQIRIAEADLDDVMARDGTHSIFVWGAQLEAQDHPFPYMRTTTGTATANKDNIETSDCDWYNNDEGTFYMSISRGPGYSSTAQRYICEISTGFGADRIFMYNTSNTPVMFATAGGVAQAIVSAADNPMSDDECLFVATYATNDFNCFGDGSASATPDTSGTPSTETMTLFSVGKAFNETLHFAGLIKDIAFIPTKLSVTEATDLSAGDRSIESFGERRASISRSLLANLTRNLARGLAN